MSQTPSRRVSSLLAKASSLPSGPNASAHGEPACPASVFATGSPVAGSQSLMFPTASLAANKLPSALKVTAIAGCADPVNLSPTASALRGSHNRTPSPATEASRLPSGLNATEYPPLASRSVSPAGCSFRVSRVTGPPVCGFHNHTPLSPAEARRLPSGLNATDNTAAPFGSGRPTSAPVFGFHNQTWPRGPRRGPGPSQ